MISANIPKNVRKHIYKRDGYRCALCDSTRGIQIHHVLPRGQGGGDWPWNLITLCSCCHALAHGQITAVVKEVFEDGSLDEMRPGDIKQQIVEYLSDYYAELDTLWTPAGPVSSYQLSLQEWDEIVKAQCGLIPWPKRWRKGGK